MAGRRHESGKRREEFWREHVSRWASSGQSIAGYCRAQDLSDGSFHYWKSVLKERDGRLAAGGGGPAFAEVRIAAAQEASIEIVLLGTRRIRVHPGFDEETLTRVLGVVERVGADAC